MTTLADKLDSLTMAGHLFEEMDERMVRCTACAHRCKIKPGRRGICQVRFNQDGVLRVPFGYVAALNLDPVEKKPFAHLLPGSDALTFGMLGCDFHCDFCQNWLTSQTLRDPRAAIPPDYIRQIAPEEVVRIAQRGSAGVVVSSYNEPLITSEWAVAIFERAKQAGLRTAYVSNGNATPQVLDYLRPHLDAYKIDLKSMRDRSYRQMGGVLKNVLDTIRRAYDLGLWVEVVTLVIPDFNDSPEELWEAARFLVSVSPSIPWHVTAFHPDYKHDGQATTPAILQQAADVGQEAGLQHIYAGNLPGRVGSLEDTHCPQCRAALIRRRGYTIIDYRLTADGKCPQCGAVIPGVWTDRPETVQLGGWGLPRQVL
ncbi:MAG: AmmeMemoRadiSam system radical SAM enzyme [Anaerolineae bacterium]|nr:AmmeMemoRadiSam system radical SAM enzyme [Anaerolineae bacterium]